MRCCNSYRFRLINIACDPNFLFSIDGHKMTVIEVEGLNVQPLVVDSIQIFVGTRGSILFSVLLINAKIGQRYSVVVSYLFFTLVQDGYTLRVCRSRQTRKSTTTVCVPVY